MKASRLRKIWLRSRQDAAERAPAPMPVKSGPVMRGENARRLREVMSRTHAEARAARER